MADAPSTDKSQMRHSGSSNSSSSGTAVSEIIEMQTPKHVGQPVAVSESSMDDPEKQASIGSDEKEKKRWRRSKKEKTQLTDAFGQPVRHTHGAWARFVPFTSSGMPADPPKSMDDAPELPYAHASLFSILIFHWIQPLLKVGYQRPLQATDLWKLDEARSAGDLSERLLEAFDARAKEAEEWNKRLKSGEYKPGFLRKRVWWPTRHFLGIGSKDGVSHPGLSKPLNDVFGRQFWLSGGLKVISDALTTTQPLVTRAIIAFGTESYLGRRGVPGYTVPDIGRGVGLAIGLLAMNLVASLFLHQFFGRSMEVGVLARGTLISAIYKRSLQLSGKSRAQIPNGRIISLISTDVSRIDFACGFSHMAWTSAIQFFEVLIILLVVLGPSCLAGIAVMLILMPFQTYAMKAMFSIRRKTAGWTDKRTKLIQELLGGMKVIKLFSWEAPYLAKLTSYRNEELKRLRKLLIIRSASMAVALSVPALGSIAAFVVYSATGHGQNAATIFTSLTLFNLLRMPLMMVPMALGTITDASAAMKRLSTVFTAEIIDTRFQIDPDAKYAVEVTNGQFIWEGAPPEELSKKQQKKADAQKAKMDRIEHKATKAMTGQATDAKHRDSSPKRGFHLKSGKATPRRPSGTSTPALQPAETTALSAEEQDMESHGIKNDAMMEPAQAVSATAEQPESTEAPAQSLELRDINIQIPKGQLTAIVGAVGAGKSSLLSALIGDMKRTSGNVTFGGSIGYCAQTAWIQNASLRNNVLFGQEFDEKRYKKALKDACLEPDLAILPDGDMTEIGEKGINLSGGQRQRVGIARALYFDADIVALDDPLSAVDAHVGQYLFDHAIKGALAGKTRILVTHALHFLPYVDFVITIKEGKVAEQGTYAELMERDGEFASLFRTFGGKMEEEREEKNSKEAEAIEEAEADEKKPADGQEGEAAEAKKPRVHMQEEERALGALSGHVFMAYLRAAKGIYMVPLVVLSIALMQGSTVLQNYWLVWWEDDTFNHSRGFYMGFYALLGISTALFTFAMGASAAFLGYNASTNLHSGAAKRVLDAPMSFFDTTPLGRVMTRFSKDVDTIDNTLNDSLRMALSTFGQVFGSIVLIGIVNQYFLIAVAAVLYMYYRAAHFYRTSAREIKRLDNLLRSGLYAHFAESLSGLATIRAYGEQNVFLAQNVHKVDTENRAYLLTVFNQRWLGIRLDFFGAILSFVVAIIAVVTRFTISPAETGLILSYIVSIQMSFSWMVRQVAEVENDMNSTERMHHYANNLEQEAPHEIPTSKPSKEWPNQGAISFKDVVMSYRPGLPIVLKGLSFEVSPGQKVGVVGRTGAGKSSIMQVLLRLVEVSSGSVVVDGVDISKIGLSDLRKAIGIIPQEALLFQGTIRSNLDPFQIYDDSVLWDALRRSWLVGAKDGQTGEVSTSRFNLDSTIEEEGANLSVGERSLVSLARALVKNSKIVCLDEATSSVDLATDAKIQETIRTEFADKTLLCIAHRLRTIISYDRILVMDQGVLAEYDAPEVLYQKNGIFTSMCERSGISLDDILRAQMSSNPHFKQLSNVESGAVSQ